MYLATINNINTLLMINLDSILFNIETCKRAPQAGALLVSEPFLREPYFCHSVISLVEYEIGKSSMGIVMNKPTSYTLGEVIERIDDDNETLIYCGGPLSCDRLYFLHTIGDIIPKSREIIEGLYIGGDFDTMIDIVNSGYDIEGKMRFFIGYSGWDAGQLESELRQNVWAVTDIPDMTNVLIGEKDYYWHRHVRHMGERYRHWRYHPENPILN